MPTFGTEVDPSHYVEIPDPSFVDEEGGTTRTKRPSAGSVLLVVDAEDLTELPSITTDAYGYWSYTTTEAHWIKVSGDGGVTWVPLQSYESRYDTSVAATNANTALANSVQAVATANTALAVAQTAGGGGEGGEEIWETAPGVYPTPATTGRHVWYGTVRPTVAQGRRPGDKFYNVVTAS